MVPAAANGFLCGRDLLAGVLMECLPQCPCGVFLTASTPLLKTILR